MSESFHLKNQRGEYIGFGTGTDWSWTNFNGAVLWPGIYNQQAARVWAAKQGIEIIEEPISEYLKKNPKRGRSKS